MNFKTIKAMRWHKKSLIDAIEKEGIYIDEISDMLDSVIDNVDMIRLNTDPIKLARKEGYADGEFAGYGDGWDAARDKYIGNRIRVKKSINVDNHYNVFVDDEYVGYQFSEAAGYLLGEAYIIESAGA